MFLIDLSDEGCSVDQINSDISELVPRWKFICKNFSELFQIHPTKTRLQKLEKEKYEVLFKKLCALAEGLYRHSCIVLHVKTHNRRYSKNLWLPYPVYLYAKNHF